MSIEVDDPSRTAVSLTERPEPLVKIRPGSDWQILNLREIAQYWDLLVSLSERDIKLRYRQTALGIAWVLVQPVVSASIFAFVFGRLANMPADSIPHLPFAYAGLLAWGLFNGTLTRAGTSLIGNTSLVSKIYFPRVILPLSAVTSQLVDFSLSLAPLVGMMAWFHLAPSVGLLTLPLWIVLLVVLGLGVGLYQGAMVVRYRDVGQVMTVGVQLMMYASPVGYSLSAVPEKYRFIYNLNPMAGLIQGFRWSLLGTGKMEWGWAAYSAAATVVLFLFGARVFKKMERRFADVI